MSKAIAAASAVACLCAAARAQTLQSPSIASQQLGNLLLGRNQPSDVRWDSARRLSVLRSPSAAAILAQALASRDPDISTTAARAIAQDDWADPQFVAPLEGVLGSDPTRNTYAAQVLVQYPGESAAAIAARLLSAASNNQFPSAARTPLVEALGSFAIKDVAAALLGMLRDSGESAEVRQAAAVALTEMSGQSRFGQDPLKWQAWWLSVENEAPDAFAADMASQRSAHFAEVIGRTERLARGLDRLLESLYFTSTPAEQPRILESYLTNDAPEIRRIGAQIVEIDVGGGRPMTAAARSRLLTMVSSDPRAEVRAAAAAALGLDPTAADFLTGRLNQETDPDALAALLNALAPRQSATLFRVAIDMLNHPSPVVANAAADLIAASGTSLRDPSQTAMRQQIETVLLAKLDNPAAADGAVLRPAFVAALAALGDINLYDRFVKLASDAEPDAVRIEAIGGLGELARINPDIAATLADFVDSPTAAAALRLKAVQQLADVPTTAYVDRMVDRLNLTPEPDPDVRAAIWQTARNWMPQMSDDRLVRLAERLRNEHDYTREVDVRRFYAEALEARKTDDALQTAASQWETIATREMEDLNHPADAAADFARVLAYYQSKGVSGDDLPHNPFRGEAAALLATGPPYDAAVRFAAEMLKDPKRQPVVPDVLEQIARVANSLASADPNNRDALTNALVLVKEFNDAKLSMPPSLSYVSDNLAAAAAAAKQNLANLGGAGQ
jgi:hypothetical protein